MATTPSSSTTSAFHRPDQRLGGHLQPSRHVDECGPSHQSLAVLMSTPRRSPKSDEDSDDDVSRCSSSEHSEFGGDLDLAEVLLLVALGQAGKGSSMLQCLSSDLLRYQVAPAVEAAHDESRRRAGLKTPELDMVAATPMRMTRQPLLGCPSSPCLAPPRIIRTMTKLPDEAIMRNRAHRDLAFGPPGFAAVLAGLSRPQVGGLFASPQVGAMPRGELPSLKRMRVGPLFSDAA